MAAARMRHEKALRVRQERYRQLFDGTLAEGIETEAQLAKLRALGCEAGQGFLFAKPLPAMAAEELIRARSAMALTAPICA